MARSIDRKKSTGYITKAENSLRISKIAIREGAYDAAVMNSVHGAINSLDALTTFFFWESVLLVYILKSSP